MTVRAKRSRRRARLIVATAGAAALAVSAMLFGGAGPASASTSPPPPGSVLDQHSDGYQFLPLGMGPVMMGQTFTAHRSGYLTAVSVGISAFYTPVDAVQIRSTTGGKPTNTVLASSSLTSVPAPSDILALPTPPLVVAGTTYAIVFPGLVAANVGDDYPDGSLVTFAEGAWGGSAFDMNFATYVAPVYPEVTDVSASTAEGSTVGIALPDVGYNITRWDLGMPPAHGAATVTGSTATYTPVAGFSGTDTFTYTATNAAGTSAPATVTVTVVPPIIALSTAQVAAGHQVTVTGTGLPGNLPVDVVLHSDPVTLATVTTSVTGAFSSTVTIPTGTPPGGHTIIVTGTGVTSRAVDLTIVPAAAIAGPALAATGTDAVPAIAAGSMLLGGGAVALLAVARRRRLEHA